MFDLPETAIDQNAVRKPLLVDLKAYLKDYPHGRYQADIKLLRASLLADEGDHATAIGDLTTILNDPAHPELHQDAALRFAEIGLRLRDLKQRQSLVMAFRRNPAARELLENLVRGDTCLFLLRPILKWLQN